MDEKEERYFTNVFTATEKMRNLIQDLLGLSKAGRTDLNLVQVDMNEIVESVRAELFDEPEERKIAWTLGTLPTAQADQGLIRVVWVNLIGNAVKYTRLRKEAKIEIGALPIEENDLGDEIQTFYVQDNGVGFDEVYIDQLFGVFQRLHQGTEFEGNGIGLATVRRIISRHGGRTWAKGKLNKGATFYFSLPVRIKLADDEKA
jgi:light-regulated signal transduction histidine kinase (bacteriophytochrome)